MHQEVNLSAWNLLPHYGGCTQAPTHVVPPAQFLHTVKKCEFGKKEVKHITLYQGMLKLLEDT